MSGVLTLTPAASPFPWAAAAISTYTNKATLNFDTAAKGVTLEIDGSQITAEDEIVQALAKASGLAGDSAKVRLQYWHTAQLTDAYNPDCRVFCFGKDAPYSDRIPRDHCRTRLTR